jgi:hypothetical protein
MDRLKKVAAAEGLETFDFDNSTRYGDALSTHTAVVLLRQFLNKPVDDLPGPNEDALYEYMSAFVSDDEDADCQHGSNSGEPVCKDDDCDAVQPSDVDAEGEGDRGMAGGVGIPDGNNEQYVDPGVGDDAGEDDEEDVDQWQDCVRDVEDVEEVDASIDIKSADDMVHSTLAAQTNAMSAGMGHVGPGATVDSSGGNQPKKRRNRKPSARKQAKWIALRFGKQKGKYAEIIAALAMEKYNELTQEYKLQGFLK